MLSISSNYFDRLYFSPHGLDSDIRVVHGRQQQRLHHGRCGDTSYGMNLHAIQSIYGDSAHRLSTQGIYPTIIIVLVCLQMTFQDNVTRPEPNPSQVRDGREKTKAPKRGYHLRQVLSWRITARGSSGSEVISSESTQTGAGMSFDSHRLPPIKPTTTTELDAWHHPHWTTGSAHEDLVYSASHASRKLDDRSDAMVSNSLP